MLLKLLLLLLLPKRIGLCFEGAFHVSSVPLCHLVFVYLFHLQAEFQILCAQAQYSIGGLGSIRRRHFGIWRCKWWPSRFTYCTLFLCR
jgi:hypothetical protein